LGNQDPLYAPRKAALGDSLIGPGVISMIAKTDFPPIYRNDPPVIIAVMFYE
jgi:hypothetical protein